MWQILMYSLLLCDDLMLFYMLLNKFAAVLFKIFHDSAEGTEHKYILEKKLVVLWTEKACLVNYVSENVWSFWFCLVTLMSLMFSLLIIMKVVFFGDNVPKDRADMAIEASRRCDAFLVLGSSLMTMSAFRLVR